jgi:hypothetical protein
VDHRRVGPPPAGGVARSRPPPRFTALTLFAAAAASAILPRVARELTGLDPESQEFSTGYAEHLGRLAHHLRDQPPT